jgi:hypothetical protein
MHGDMGRAYDTSEIVTIGRNLNRRDAEEVFNRMDRIGRISRQFIKGPT